MHSPLPHPSARWSVATTAFLVVAGPTLAIALILGLLAWFFYFGGVPDEPPPPVPPPRPAHQAK